MARLKADEREVAKRYEARVRGLAPLLTDTMRRAFLAEEVFTVIMHSSIVGDGKVDGRYYAHMFGKLREHFAI